MRSSFQRFLHHKRIVQFAEFMVGGGVFFFSGMAVFAVLYSGLHMDWLWAKIIGDTVGWTLGYFVQRYWAFNDKALAHKNLQVGKRYVLINIVNFAIDYAIVAALKHAGVTPYLGMWISSQFFTLWNYLWFRFWVFDPKQK